MSARQYLEAARASGIVVIFDIDRIRVTGPNGAVAAALPELRAHEPHLRLLLEVERRRPCGVAPIPGAASALELVHVLEWSEDRLRDLSQRVLGRPGPASVADDGRVIDAILATLREDYR